MPLNVFLSYRRQDSRADAGRIYDRCAAEFGRQSVFKDVDSIPYGQDFRGAVAQAIKQCDVLLVVIGQGWLDARDEWGQRRLDSPDDFVRMEIEHGLQRADCLVIPLLVDQATMPAAADLPESLRPLAYKQALTLHDDPDFHRDIDTLFAHIRRSVGRGSGTGRFPRVVLPVEAGASAGPLAAPAVERPVNLGFDGPLMDDGQPLGWFNGAGHVTDVSERYEIRVVPREYGQGACARLSIQQAAEGEFGALMQRFPAEYLAGKTLRFEGELRSEEIQGWAGLWLRADGVDRPDLFFDNMARNPLRGTHSWNLYSLDAVLPKETAWLNFGLVLAGSGYLWADHLKLLVWERDHWAPL